MSIKTCMHVYFELLFFWNSYEKEKKLALRRKENLQFAFDFMMEEEDLELTSVGKLIIAYLL